jgi:hypothetical protein
MQKKSRAKTRTFTTRCTSDATVRPVAQNICFRFPENYDCVAPSRRDAEGVSRSSRHVRLGCDGREDGARRASSARTAKSCGPDTPTLVSSSQADEACVRRGQGLQPPKAGPRLAAALRPADRRSAPTIVALTLRGRDLRQQLGCNCAAGRRSHALSGRHCERLVRRSSPSEGGSEAMQTISAEAVWIASARSLSSGRALRGPVGASQ